MSKPKALLKHSKTKKKSEQVLDTVDDFQAAGVDFEEAAGKWRAGDAVKSMRFFSRAVEVYSQGLQKFPGSLDLAYNKARVLLEIATHPILVNQLQIPMLDALQQALDAHQYALSLDQDNPDTLFNTAQVLTSMAEIRAKDGADQQALESLEQALELQTRCLNVQEFRLDESIQQQTELEAQVGSDGAPSDLSMGRENEQAADTAAKASQDQWFSIVEPMTKDTLVDTILAQLATLTTLCSILSTSTVSPPSSSLAWVENFSSKLIKAKLPALLEEATAERLQEVALTTAIFVSNLLEAGYRAGSVDALTYKRERDNAFKSPDLGLDTSFTALSANANSLIAFSAAIRDREQATAESQASQAWNALSTAMANLAAAAKISDPVPDEIAETHLLRGNCSLLQFQLGQPPVSFQTAAKNGGQLLKNADVFYRNATKLFQIEDQKSIAHFRSDIVQALLGGSDVAAVAMASGKDQEWARNQLDDMIEEGLISILA